MFFQCSFSDEHPGDVGLQSSYISIFAMASQAGKKKRACVIGDTKQGGYGHGFHLAWSHRGDVEVVGLADPDAEGRAARNAETGAKRTYADYREMLEKERPDLVAIGPRWPIHHEEYLLACAHVGAHGYLEKPVAVDLAEADTMVAAVEEKDLKWAVGHQVRLSPLIEHTKKLVFQDDLIGDILEMRSRGKEDRRAGGEDLIVLGCHVFDLMLLFMEEKPSWCEARIEVDGRLAEERDVREATEPLGPIVGNQIHAVFEFKGGAPGYFSSRKNADGNGGRYGLDLYGSKGIVKIRVGFPPRIAWLDRSSWTGKEDADSWNPLPDAPSDANSGDDQLRNARVIDDLIQAIEDDREPRASLQRGRNALEMVQSVFASHVARGRVEIPLKKRSHPLRNWS